MTEITFYPIAVDSEQYVLACILVAPETVPIVIERLSEYDFYESPHKTIYQAATQLFRENKPVDVASVPSYLKDNGFLASAGGVAYINELALSHTTSTALEYHIDRLRDYRLRRELLSLSGEIPELLEELTVTECLKTLMDGVSDMNQLSKGEKTEDYETLKAQIIQEIEEGKRPGISTGFRELDRLTEGFNPTDLVILAARPGMGKSALALNIANNVAFRQGLPVLFYSLEMNTKDLIKRILFSETQSRTRLDDMRKVKIPDHYVILEPNRFTIQDFQASLMKYKYKFGKIGLVVVDYIGLIDLEGKASQYEKITQISQQLKRRIAREFEVPVLALSQLSRNLEGRQDKRPTMADLRDSGAIEQDADEIIFIYRDEYYNQDSNKKNIAEIAVAKNRDGERGNFEVIFLPEYSLFKEKETYHHNRFNSQI